MPTPDTAVAVLTSALSELTSALSPAPSHEGAITAVAPESLQHKLNGGTEARIGAHYADVVVQERALPADARVLDLGCGFGRVALDLASRLTDDQAYFGLDPNAEAIAWARENIASRRANFTFDLIDVVSQPYNPDGELVGARYAFPFDDHSLDRVFMISVLTHVDLATVRNYLEEAARTLKPDTGRLVATFFLLDPEVEKLVAAGRSAYQLPWQLGESRVENRENPELVIAHPRERVEDILRDAGFANFEVRQGHWSGRPSTSLLDYQDVLVADFGTVTPAPPRAEVPTATAEHESLAELLHEHGVAAGHIASYLVWALSTAVNALRWQEQGHGVLLEDEAGGEVAVTTLERVRGLDFATCIPSTTPFGAYFPFDETALLTAIRETSPEPTAAQLVELLGEVAHFALAVDRALLEGRAFQSQPGGGQRPAPIPAPPTAAPAPPRTARSRVEAFLTRFRRS